MRVGIVGLCLVTAACGLEHRAGGDALRRPSLARAPLLRARRTPSPATPLDRLRGGAAASAVDLGWLSVLPPLVALGASIALKQVILALLLGVFTGCLLLSRGDPLSASLRAFDTYFVDAFTPRDHAGVLLFTFLLGGTIGLVQKAGGGPALAELLTSYMRSARSALGVAACLCSLVFFDDYSSILIVGETPHPPPHTRAC